MQFQIDLLKSEELQSISDKTVSYFRKTLFIRTINDIPKMTKH